MLSFCWVIPTTIRANTGHPKQHPLTRSELKRAEARLAEMGYTPGRVDGVIDDDTRNAVITFQKWEDRKTTGQLTRKEFDAIMSAAA
ncbi:MAG TPA: peptidoglycan-binding domain-containing protein, partial [Pyrinomonadaceae bacterium]|nr:peptidoglycan-binding domain-containing protein [Pyrinomonadaceae bacterium]